MNFSRFIAVTMLVAISNVNSYFARADYFVQSSTNLTEWVSDSISWDTVLEMARTNPAPGKPHYYYRLSPPEPEQPTYSIPQGLVWNYLTNLTGVSWASDQTNVVQLSENLWVIQNPATVFFVSPTSTNALQSTTTLTEWIMTRTAAMESERYSDGFHAGRQFGSERAAPIKERATIGDPFYPIPSRSLAWTYDPNFTGAFEIWWGSDPSNLVQVGETTNRSWRITVPARLGWFGVRAIAPNGYASTWATVPNLK